MQISGILTRRADAVAVLLFRLCGDVSHVVSIVVLALRLNATKSAVGISPQGEMKRYADLTDLARVSTKIVLHHERGDHLHGISPRGRHVFRSGRSDLQ